MASRINLQPMASRILCRRAPIPTPAASKLLQCLLFNPARTFAPSSSAIRSFNADAQMSSESDSDDLDRRVEEAMDQMRKDPKMREDVLDVGGAPPPRHWFEIREDADRLYLRIDLPGLGKENVKVRAEKDTLIIRAADSEDSEESRRRFSSRFNLPDKVYKSDEIKTVMKNGELKVTVPKKQEEKKKDVHQVKIY